MECRTFFEYYIKKVSAPRNYEISGCSSVVERALWEREAAGSSPVTPTKFMDYGKLALQQAKKFRGKIVDLATAYTPGVAQVQRQLLAIKH